MIFYAPLRGLREARDRGSLLPIAFLTFLSQVAYSLVVNQFSGAGGWRTAGSIWGESFRSAMFVVLVAVIFVPVLTLVSNLFDNLRRWFSRSVTSFSFDPNQNRRWTRLCRL